MSNTKIVNGKLCIDKVQLNEIIPKLKVVKEVYKNNASKCVTDFVIKRLQGYDEETIFKHFLGLLDSEKTRKLADVIQNFHCIQ